MVRGICLGVNSMSIRRVWFLTLGAIAVISVFLSVAIWSFLTDQSFNQYLEERHQTHVDQILTYTQSALSRSDISYRQMRMEYEAHLGEPIIGIKLYQTSGKLLLEVGSESIQMPRKHGMMAGRDSFVTETQVYEIVDKGVTIAKLHITQTSSTTQTVVAQLFKKKLWRNGLIAVLFALVVAMGVAQRVSRRMSQNLIQTAEMAEMIESGESEIKVVYTGVKEIEFIREKLTGLKQRLDLKQRMRKEIVDQMIHETRTPLTILKTQLEAMDDGVVKADSLAYGLCLFQVQRLQKTIEAINDMIVEEVPLTPVTLESIYLPDLIGNVLASLKLQFKSSGIELKVTDLGEVEGGTQFFVSDRFKLEKVLFNLLVNAIKYTSSGGCVGVLIRETPQQLEIEVSDTGIGIAKEEIDLIFEPYYRSPNVSEIEGEGLGLYDVKNTLKQLGGSVKVVSALDRGSTFSVILPK